MDGALYDKADGAAVYAALDTKADKTAVDAIAPKAHTHANASVLDETTAAFTTEEHEIISALQNDLDVFYTDLNILQNDVTNEIAPKAHEHTNKGARQRDNCSDESKLNQLHLADRGRRPKRDD